MLPLLVLAATLGTVRALLVPGPLGPFPVAMRVQELTDESRWDPYAPAHEAHRRRILVSVFLPLEPGHPAKTPVQVVPYMPPATAAQFGQLASTLTPLADDFFSRFSIEYHRLPPAQNRPKDGPKPRYPVVLFSPGLEGSRLGYSAGARALASQGYVVITVDHPYDASIVEFPDGSVVHAVDISTIPDAIRAIEVRAADISFIIDRLHDPSALQQLTGCFPGEVDVAKVAMYGHSLGGATVAAAMLKDERILGGMNLDGHIFGPVAHKGFDRPFALVGVPGHGPAPNSSWPELYSHLRGPKLELAVAKTQHYSFTDAPLLVTALRIPDKDRAAIEAVVGSMNGWRMQRTVLGIVTAFLDLVFNGNAEEVRNLGNEFCDVSMVKSWLPGRR
ncbi:platelet-activating factor acetylhydrolase, isoform II domain-containing protein [Hirsutella rhossiliensis]|uniref:1-alkyl-2-acetylglycerophosphocholine esterase n=1 Tax=Hirsutella rhossiliensis TaxID=111463 RepID=A0A9P8SPP8_9HYPO|nr:platelet-activating factor acetylhydrolase, isoform II domain-containing protein [Hirsutella rhossiliensis]KAH0968436.1 platelet-activating factor acetylhydrolase, isoform II domain-containing protein [Hirsutella rhossiliensis]